MSQHISIKTNPNFAWGLEILSNYLKKSPETLIGDVLRKTIVINKESILNKLIIEAENDLNDIKNREKMLNELIEKCQKDLSLINDPFSKEFMEISQKLEALEYEKSVIIDSKENKKLLYRKYNDHLEFLQNVLS